jgi:hypothetical protein
VLVEVLEPSLERAGKERAVDHLLDEYSSFDEGSECHQDNAWCDAPERAYGSPVLLSAGGPQRRRAACSAS